MKSTYLFLFSLALTGPVSAQDSALGVPVLGFAFDSNQAAIRPIRGIPGAAVLGEALDFGFPIASAAVAPRQDFALAFAAGEPPRIVALNGGGVAALADAVAAPERMVFSPSGSSAVLVTGQRVQIVTGLPGHPLVEEISTTAVSGVPSTIAVSDDGKLLIVGDSNQNLMWLFKSDREPVLLPLSGLGAVVLFRRNMHDAAAVSQSGDLYLLQNLDDAPAVQSVLPGSDHTAGVAGLWLSDDGSQAFVALASGNIATVDLASGAAQSVPCQCTPTGIAPLRPGMFGLTEVSSRPVMVLDASTSKPRVWFVPVRSNPEPAGGAK